jgi:predicted dithiol-disulfide oxidoreductase (DUF899 family)
MSNMIEKKNRAVVSRDTWLAARRELLLREKAMIQQLDDLSRRRRELPWVKVEKTYMFDTPEGKVTLADLFAGRSQLIVHHFMFAPGWKEGCVGCSMHADHAEAALVHLLSHDVNYVRVSRAPLATILPFNKRMGWRTEWVSSYGSDFNYDYNVAFSEEDRKRGRVHYNFVEGNFVCEEMSGISVFCNDETGELFHTYSAHARGEEGAMGTYFFLDLLPSGRGKEAGDNLEDWVRHHDRYDASGLVELTGTNFSPKNSDKCCSSKDSQS